MINFVVERLISWSVCITADMIMIENYGWVSLSHSTLNNQKSESFKLFGGVINIFWILLLITKPFRALTSDSLLNHEICRVHAEK